MSWSGGSSGWYERGGVAADAMAACGVSYEGVERVLRGSGRRGDGLPGAV
ncbi:hypothetical protein [Streptomyces sp. NBC_01306]|nr:hypothetical protein [Streptomyces sp. NBC_01306]MCX4723812.1 hypothetical protein [Streptomyces sp. NBC_01306]